MGCSRLPYSNSRLHFTEYPLVQSSLIFHKMLDRATLVAVLIACLATTSARQVQVSHIDAAAHLFPNGARHLLSVAAPITFETMRLVQHPTRPGALQRKVLQTHHGLSIFGHSFVLGLAADGVTEQPEGTYGTVLTGMEAALPDITPTILATQAARIAAQDPLVSGNHAAELESTELVVWLQHESESFASATSAVGSTALAHLAWVVRQEDGVTVIVDAHSGSVLRSWREMHTVHAPRLRGLEGGNAEAGQKAGSSSSSVRGMARRSLAGKRPPQDGLTSLWGIGGNEKVGRIFYNGSSRGSPALVATRKGRECSFVNTAAKVGNATSIMDWKKWAKLASSSNLSVIRQLYLAVPPVSYPCPAAGRYVKTGDTADGAFSQVTDTLGLMGEIFSMWQEWFGVDVNKQILAAAGVPVPLLVIPHAQFGAGAAWRKWYFFCEDTPDPSSSYPYCTAGDVMAHELAHGVTDFYNGGLLYYGQSGGFNEAFSDFAGMTFNFYSTGKVEPLLGASIARDAAASRDLSDPARFGQADSLLNLTTLDPHLLSGIPNEAFFRLSTSPCYDPKVSSPWCTPDLRVR